MPELTANPFWKFACEGSDVPKITAFLGEAQSFVKSHDVTSIDFYVEVMLTAPPQATEKSFNEKQLTKEELNSLTPQWVEEQVEKAFELAEEFWDLQ
jgi:hypothetical protein